MVLTVAALVAWPTALGGIAIDGGIVSLDVTDRFSDANCASPFPDDLCVIGWEDSGTSGPGDDRIVVYRDYEKIEFRFVPSVAPVAGDEVAPLLPDESLGIPVSSLEFDQPLFRVVMAGQELPALARQELPARVIAQESGMMVTSPLADSDEFTWDETTFIDYGHARPPAYFLSTDTESDLGGFLHHACSTLDPSPPGLAEGCRAAGVEPAASVAFAATPSIVTGFDVENISVQSNSDPTGQYGWSELTQAPGDQVWGAQQSPLRLPSAIEAAAPLDPAPLPFTPSRAQAEPSESKAPWTSRSEWAPTPTASPPPLKRAVIVGALVLSLGILALLPILALYRRLTRTDIRSQETRQRLMDVVRAHPGVSSSEAARALGVHPRAVDYHIRLLQDAHLLSVLRRPGRVALFLPAVRPASESAIALERANQHEVSRGILHRVAAMERATRRDVLEALSAPRRTVLWHVARLIEDGILVETDAEGASGVLTLASAAKAGSAAPQRPHALRAEPATSPTSAS